VIVVDCTVIADHLFGDQLARAATERLQELDPEWISLGLVFFEAGNVAWKLSKFGRLSPADGEALVGMIERLLAGIEIHPDSMAIYRLASDSGLTFYDASYVWLAQCRGLQLRTRDQQILQAYPEVARPMPGV
jgi:predicted nucleic acid-binding protein